MLLREAMKTGIDLSKARFKKQENFGLAHRGASMLQKQCVSRASWRGKLTWAVRDDLSSLCLSRMLKLLLCSLQVT